MEVILEVNTPQLALSQLVPTVTQENFTHWILILQTYALTDVFLEEEVQIWWLYSPCYFYDTMYIYFAKPKQSIDLGCITLCLALLTLFGSWTVPLK